MPNNIKPVTKCTSNILLELEQVMKALRTIRVQTVKEESFIHDQIKQVFDLYNIAYHHEYKLAPRNRIDFFVSGGIGVEVKKGKPYSKDIYRQLKRYAQFDEIKAVILVIERYQDVPEEINGKPCRSIGLRKLWGISSG